MKRIFGISLITLSISILLLHSFVPHHHSENGFNLDEILKNEPVNSAIDLLKVGFHINLGSNHLENFQKSEQFSSESQKNKVQNLNLLSFGDTVDPIEISFSFYSQLYLPYPKSSFQSLFSTCFTYRGPPLFA